eukprot:4826335-Pyramimonas_sp.AAC.1
MLDAPPSFVPRVSDATVLDTAGVKPLYDMLAGKQNKRFTPKLQVQVGRGLSQETGAAAAAGGYLGL